MRNLGTLPLRSESSVTCWHGYNKTREGRCRRGRDETQAVPRERQAPAAAGASWSDAGLRPSGPAPHTWGAGERSGRSNAHVPTCAHGSATHGGRTARRHTPWPPGRRDAAHGSPGGHEGLQHGRTKATSRGAPGEGRGADTTTHAVKDAEEKGRERASGAPWGQERAGWAGPGAAQSHAWREAKGPARGLQAGRVDRAVQTRGFRTLHTRLVSKNKKKPKNH